MICLGPEHSEQVTDFLQPRVCSTPLHCDPVVPNLLEGKVALSRTVLEKGVGVARSFFLSWRARAPKAAFWEHRRFSGRCTSQETPVPCAVAWHLGPGGQAVSLCKCNKKEIIRLLAVSCFPLLALTACVCHSATPIRITIGGPRWRIEDNAGLPDTLRACIPTHITTTKKCY